MVFQPGSGFPAGFWFSSRVLVFQPGPGFPTGYGFTRSCAFALGHQCISNFEKTAEPSYAIIGGCAVVIDKYLIIAAVAEDCPAKVSDFPGRFQPA